MNLSHPAAQRLLALALALEARAESLISPPSPVPGFQRLKETVALEHSSTASDLRRISEMVGEPTQAMPALIATVLAHCRGVADEHAQLLELLQHFVWLAGGEPEDCERLADEYGVDTDPADPDYHRDIELELHAAGCELIGQCTCRTPDEEQPAPQAVMDFADQPYFPIGATG